MGRGTNGTGATLVGRAVGMLVGGCVGATVGLRVVASPVGLSVGLVVSGSVQGYATEGAVRRAPQLNTVGQVMLDDWTPMSAGTEAEQQFLVNR